MLRYTSATSLSSGKGLQIAEKGELHLRCLLIPERQPPSETWLALHIPRLENTWHWPHLAHEPTRFSPPETAVRPRPSFCGYFPQRAVWSKEIKSVGVYRMIVHFDHLHLSTIIFVNRQKHTIGIRNLHGLCVRLSRFHSLRWRRFSSS